VSFSTLLFATPSFWGGMSQCLDIGATQAIYNDSESELEADMNAIFSDWAAVGIDMQRAIESFAAKEQSKA
jgi:hypothetical protein